MTHNVNDEVLLWNKAERLSVNKAAAKRKLLIQTAITQTRNVQESLNEINVNKHMFKTYLNS